MTSEYKRNIALISGLSCKTLISGSKLLILVKVLDNANSPRLEIAATDIKGRYWDIILNEDMLIDHFNSLDLQRFDLKKFFLMMSEAFEENFISGEILQDELKIFVDYPIGQAKLRGEFVLDLKLHVAPDTVANLVFSFIEKVELKNLKRIRDPSPEIKSQATDVNRIKAKVVKKKKPKQIGSKIL